MNLWSDSCLNDCGGSTNEIVANPIFRLFLQGFRHNLNCDSYLEKCQFLYVIYCRFLSPFKYLVLKFRRKFPNPILFEQLYTTMKLKFDAETSSLPIIDNEIELQGLSEDSSSENTEMLQDGIEAAQKGDRAEARHLLMRVTEADPKNESAWLWLASISEYPEELLVFLNNVLGINPKNEKALKWAEETKSVLAKTFIQRGVDAKDADQRDFAKQCFLQAIVHDSQSELAWLWLASVSDSSEEKISHLNRVLSINPKNEDAEKSLVKAKAKMAQKLLAKAKDADNAGDKAETEKLLEEVIKLEPESEEAWMMKSQYASSPAEKVSHLEKVLSINPDNQSAAGLLEQAQIEKAHSMLAKAKSLTSSGKNDEAKSLLEEILSLDPEFEDALFLRVDLADSIDERVANIEKILSINPNNDKAIDLLESTKLKKAQSLLAKAKAALAKDAKDEAAKLLDSAAEYDEQLEDVWYLKSELSESLDEKSYFLGRVLEINPENAEAKEALALVEKNKLEHLLSKANKAFAAGKRNKAHEILQDVFIIEPENEDAWLLKAQLADSFHEKKSYLEKVLNINPDSEAAWEAMREAEAELVDSILVKANKAAASGNRDEARRYVEDAMKHDAEHEEAWLLKAHLTDPFDEQIVCFEKVLEINPENALAKANVTSLKAIVEKINSDESLAAKDIPQDDSLDEDSDESLFNNTGDLSDELNIEDWVDEVNGKLESLDPSNSSEELEEQADEALEVETVLFNTSELEDVSLEEPEEYEVNEPAEMELEPIQKPASFESIDAVEKEASEELVSEEEVHPVVEEFEMNESEWEDDESEAAVETLKNVSECPFCDSENEMNSLNCGDCHAVLSFSDIEMLFSNPLSENWVVEEAIERMEVEKESGEFNSEQLKDLALGYINTKKYRQGFEYLKEAAQANPGDVLLLSQIDAFAIRLSEIEGKSNSDGEVAGKKIMVVDDSPTIRKLISGKLEKSGHEAICAVDGLDAIAALEEFTPDLVLLDIAMPRMDGYQVCKFIRGNEETKDIPVIMISGKDGFFDKVMGKMAGTSHYIAKPFGPEALMKTVNGFLAE